MCSFTKGSGVVSVGRAGVGREGVSEVASRESADSLGWCCVSCVGKP